MAAVSPAQNSSLLEKIHPKERKVVSVSGSFLSNNLVWFWHNILIYISIKPFFPIRKIIAAEKVACIPANSSL